MPYIKEEHREILDPIINDLKRTIVNITLDDESVKLECLINYMILKMLSEMYTAKNYDEINDVIGMLECCKLEYYRKVAAIVNDQSEYDYGEILDPLNNK